MRPSALILISLLIGACGDKAPAVKTGQAAPIPVEVATAFRDTVIDALTATGDVEPMQQVALGADVTGRVVGILFNEGSRVEKGAALVKIDDAELKAQVARATAERDLAKQNLDRTRGLVAEQAAAPADLERAEAAARAAEASLDLLAVQLGRTTVRAPFAGVIGTRQISLGDYVTPQTPLLTLQTVSPQRISFTVPERYAAELTPGQEVAFRVAALPGRTFTARVDFVDPVVTLPARTIRVKAVTGNGDGALQAGMFIEARLTIAARANATVIPEEAISPTAGASYVWVVNDGRASRREVEVGVRSPGLVEIRRGVEPGDEVVIGGLDKLVEGAPVTVTRVAPRPVEVGAG